MSVERIDPPRRGHGGGRPRNPLTIELLDATAAAPGEWFASRGVGRNVSFAMVQALRRHGREVTIRLASGKRNSPDSTVDVYARLPEGGDR